MRIKNGLECAVNARVTCTIALYHWSAIVNNLIDEESKNN